MWIVLLIQLTSLPVGCLNPAILMTSSCVCAVFVPSLKISQDPPVHHKSSVRVCVTSFRPSSPPAPPPVSLCHSAASLWSNLLTAAFLWASAFSPVLSKISAVTSDSSQDSHFHEPVSLSSPLRLLSALLSMCQCFQTQTHCGFFWLQITNNCHHTWIQTHLWLVL